MTSKCITLMFSQCTYDPSFSGIDANLFELEQFGKGNKIDKIFNLKILTALQQPKGETAIGRCKPCLLMDFQYIP